MVIYSISNKETLLSGFSSNYKAFASELLGNVEEISPRLLDSYNNIFSMFKSSITLQCVIRCGDINNRDKMYVQNVLQMSAFLLVTL